jgi:nitrate reductase NapD
MDMKAVTKGINISSVILGRFSRRMPSAVTPGNLQALDGVEVHAVAEDGRMIVSIESASEGATVDTFEQMRQLPGVLSASLVYHQYESDPDEEA